jgi:predicted TIM-barrel fold metal-dependent hydrolase
MSDASFAVIDVDSHVTEVPDLWTSRLPKSWGDDVPHLWFDEDAQLDRWKVGSTPLTPVGYFAATRHQYPDYPSSLSEADPGSYDPKVRIERLDEFGIEAQVLYPNIIGFNSYVFAQLPRERSIACVQAYNDHMSEFAATSPKRFVPIAMLPFWDVEATCREIERVAGMGYKGVLFAAHWERLDLPPIEDEIWHPVLATAQEAGVSLNTHIGFQRGEIVFKADRTRDRLPMVAQAVNTGLANASAVARFVGNGICHKYPDLKFVSVESGFNYLPWVLDSMDWHFKNLNVGHQYPDMELPSTYFHRQVYATFWFEQLNTESAVEFQDNIMFETDYPHPTSLMANEVSIRPLDFVEGSIKKLPPEVAKKVLHDNAAKLYGLA